MTQKPFVKLYKMAGKNYVYDANKNSVLNLSDNQYSFLEKCIKNDISNYRESEEIRNLCEEGFLQPSNIKKIEHPHADSVSYYLENNLKMLTLQVTQQCNFRCEYCIYSGDQLNRSHSSKKMSISTALKSIDFLINNSRNSNTIFISFYGGEPLLEFEFIKTCIDYAKEKSEGKKVVFSMTTNASLLSDEVIQCLYDNDVNLMISIDGPKEIHDKHRKFVIDNESTFDKVFSNIKKIREKFPNYINKISFNAVVNPENDFNVINNFFTNCNEIKDINSRIGIAIDTNNTFLKGNSDEYYLNREYELFKIFYCLIKKKNTKKCSKVAIEYLKDLSEFSRMIAYQKIAPEQSNPSGACMPGVQRLFVTVEGNFYPCEKVSESSEFAKIGNINTGFDIGKIKKLLSITKNNEENCKKCWAIKFCGICAAILYNEGFCEKSQHQHCKGAKIAAEEKLKNYCFLKEFSYDFNQEEESNVIGIENNIS
ncbi:Cys-rich peptide radical SAM maturase CcpM [Clostridium botulinum]|uniref:Cys-rich peptide radical SAM maturase CcpM n=1 Tax=Clostridium botulinum TaxID=1491 RepID=UPI001400DEE5|nr:Cys-rich peptide radical SAM maturase CcpM [Clostridium botulinum]MBY6914834.1 Cys-rich peptide radical SAM maturase CcpM [Clostridium botulinum]NFO38858.1 Cys-rich peptide radical SAM maturase CcpM [Clostridium botulinum]NFQ39705.1 Cys-rich peptide radical SAM maturase CcpM [Clostridium botulinum]